ncbi:MAG: FG-GAP-like repeat-containing protein [Phycisphaerales bacterium]|nr:VCBS repeat-containing protein [Planctomycetota bacterium]
MSQPQNGRRLLHSSLSLRRTTAIALAAGWCWFGGLADAQVSVGGLRFVDRAALGQISLGSIRGSLGVIDFDNDGWFDLFFADVAGAPNRLFRNVASPSTPGGRTFVDVTSSSGIADADGTARGFGGVVILDFDNDGWSDIYTIGPGAGLTGGVLYRNNGNGTFTNVSIASGVRQTDTAPSSASACDFDHDGWTDLLIINSGYGGKALLLLRNNGDGTFSKRNDLVPATTFAGITYASTWTDYNRDGWEDALVCFNNTVPLTLCNAPDGAGGRRLNDATAASGFTHVGPAPMGIATGDIDRDGWQDLVITDAVSGTYYRNDSGHLTEIKPFSTFFGWGTTLLDANNDGTLDNYQAGSFSSANVDFLVRNNGDGTWTNAQAALNTTALPSQQCARIDFDNDGFEDIITINPGRFVSIYHNQSGLLPGAGHWSSVRLHGGHGVNQSAIGARVRLYSAGGVQMREIVAGSSYSASEDPRAHFGLGADTTIDSIEVIWPRRGSVAQRTTRFAGPFPIDTELSITAPAPCPADQNADGVVDDGDFALFARSYDLLLCTDPAQETDCPADLSGDWKVDDSDFVLFVRAYSDFFCP